MKHLLPCTCGQTVEVEPSQAGQTVACTCGKSLLVPSMLRVKSLPIVPSLYEESETKRSAAARLSALFIFILGNAAILVTILLWAANVVWPDMYWYLHGDLFFILFFGLSGALLCTSFALMLRNLFGSPLSEDTAIRRTFFIIGIVLLLGSFLLAPYLYLWTPQPKWVSLKRNRYAWGEKMLYQDSTPIAGSEHRILWMTDEQIDRMMPMELYFYFCTLEEPTFSYNFQDNYESVKDGHRIWVVVNVLMFIFAFLGVGVSFFMSRREVVVTGWSGSDWT
jgi:hypothetical protein